jgi:hypothetical protein
VAELSRTTLQSAQDPRDTLPEVAAGRTDDAVLDEEVARMLGYDDPGEAIAAPRAWKPTCASTGSSRSTSTTSWPP